WKVSVPGAVPFSTYENESVAVAPAAMSWAAGTAGVDAPAPPVPTACAFACTARATVPPVFVIRAEMVKPCPRLTALGVCTAMESAAPSWTVAAAAGEVVETTAPLLASVPEAIATTDSVPAEVPDSTQDQRNVSDAPPATSWGAGAATTVRPAPP